MNAGKSTVLLQSAYNYNERGMEVLLFTSRIDDRYGVGKIASRIGISMDAIAVGDQFDFLQFIETEYADQPKLSCVLVDEAQFLTKQQVWQLATVVDELDIPVLCYGLRTDFLGEPFVGSKYLLAIADNLIEIKTICHCGRKATMIMRVDAHGNKVTEGAQIMIGGNDLYVPTCRLHYARGVSGVSFGKPTAATAGSIL